MPPSTGRRIAQAAVVLMALEAVEQATGLVKQMVIAAQFGTSAILDAYFVATTVAGLVLLWATLPINQVLIPMFRHDLARHGERVAWTNASVLFNNVAVILFCVSVAVALLASPLVSLLAPGFDPGAQSLATVLAQIVVPSVLFMGVARVLAQLYYSYERFVTPGAAGLVNNVALVVGFVAVAHAWGVHGLAVAVVFGALVELLLLVPILWEKRRYYVARIDLRAPQMTELRTLSLPLLVTAGGTEVARITDRVFASLLSAGSLTALGFAQRLTSLQNDFLLRPLIRSTDPHFAQLSAERDFPALSQQLFRYLRLMFFVAVPVTVAIAVLSDDVVRLLFQRGAFDDTSVRLTSHALLAYTLGYPATSLSRVLDRTFFALKETRTPTRMALLRIAVKIGLAFALLRPLAHVGIALAESLSQFIRLPLLLRALPAEIRRQEIGRTVAAFGRTVAAGGVMAAIMLAADERVASVAVLPLRIAALSALGFAAFAGVALVLQRDEARTVARGLAACLPASLARGRRA